MNFVSIPYGTIKSDSNYESALGSQSFQFLMVRLKDWASLAIESAIDLFQFLMVRLKVVRDC